MNNGVISLPSWRLKVSGKVILPRLKIIAIHKTVLYSDSDAIPRVTCKNIARTGALSYRKKNNSNTPNHKGTQRYVFLYNKSEITEHKYMSHISESYFFNRYNQASLKDYLGGNLGNLDKAVKQTQKTDKKWEK